MEKVLPKSWVETELEYLTKVVTKGSTPTSYGFNYKSEGISFIRVENIDKKGQISDISVFIDDETHDYLKRSKLVENDILFSIAGTIGRIGLVQKEILPANTNQALAIIRLYDKNLTSFISYALKSGLIQESSKKGVVGVGRANLSLTNIKALQIPLPPLAEQKRIVKKLDDLFGHLERLEGLLAEVPQLLKDFRQSVLTQAVSGKLTEEWRVGKELEEWKESLTKIKEFTGKKTIEYNTDNKNWINIKLKEISKRVSVGHVGKTSEYYTNEKDGVPFLRSQNVKPGRIVLNKVAYITHDFHNKLKKSQLEVNDLLIVRVGANRGDATILREKFDKINCANIVFARPFKWYSPFLDIFFQSSKWLSLVQKISTGTAQGVINTKIVGNVTLTLPPMKEQVQIVRQVEHLFQIADNIEAQYEVLKGKIEVLPQAILAKAFRGELVEQLDTDGDARELLKAIKAMKEKMK